MSEHSFEVVDAIKHGVEPAVILKNLRFWLAKNAANGRHLYDGYYWTYNTAKAFSVLFPYWSSNKIQKLLKKMEDSGLIISGSHNEHRYDRTKWYTLPEFAVATDSDPADTNKPNGLLVSSKRLMTKSQTAGPIPDSKPDDKPDDKPDKHLVPAVAATPDDSEAGTQKSPQIDEQFEAAWKAYPKREGANPKNKALSSWNARRKEGVSTEDMMQGVIRYAAYCTVKGSIGTEYVMQAQRFFGKGREYENVWSVPSGGKPRPPAGPDFHSGDTSWADDLGDL